MYVEITAPATRIEQDENEDIRVYQEAEIIRGISIDRGNPNIDYYFHREFLADYRTQTVNGQRWELDLTNAEVSIDVMVPEVMACAENRAAEDMTTVGAVVEQWNSYDDAPRAIHDAHMICQGKIQPSGGR